MTLQEFLQQLWKDNKAAVFTALVALLAILFGLPAIAYDAGQTNPDPVAVITAIAENPDLLAGARATPTKKPAATATPTKTKTPTKPPITSTPVPATATPLPVSTIPTIVVTEIIADDGCIITNLWKPPRDEPCGHLIMGENPRNPEIVKIFDTYGVPGAYEKRLDTYGEMWQSWISSEAEIKHHWRGFVWLWTVNTNCDQESSNNTDFTNKLCIVYSMDRIHGDGSNEHGTISRHSKYTNRVVCSKDTAGKVIISKETCGVFWGGMSQAESDQTQAPYKQFFCDMPTDNPVWTAANPPDLLNGGTYHAVPIEDRGGLLLAGWWFHKPTAVEAKFYPTNPNTLFGLTYLEEVWGVFQTYVCGWTVADAQEAGYVFSDLENANTTMLELSAAIKSETHKWPISPNGGHNFFMVLNAYVQAFFKVPQSGWSDPYGNIYGTDPNPGCTVPSFYCIPYGVEGNYPTGKEALLQRRFPGADPEKCETAPCLIFPTGNVELLPPAEDVPKP